uniref:SFRICE_008395 n=1 Tax=Spodoptera frugiperda TaxID=7108 RepID=A0A2H1WAM9_SPOFR
MVDRATDLYYLLVWSREVVQEVMGNPHVMERSVSLALGDSRVHRPAVASMNTPQDDMWSHKKPASPDAMLLR